MKITQDRVGSPDLSNAGTSRTTAAAIAAAGAGETVDPRDTRDFLLRVAQGEVLGYSLVRKFGYNADVDQTSTPETIWSQGGVWVPPTTARLHDIVSSSGNDNPLGTGVDEIELFGLDASGALQSEKVAVNGLTPVTTANTYTMVHRLAITKMGSSATGYTNAGTITATAQTDSTVTCAIPVAKGQSTLGVYQIPASTDGYLLRYAASIVKGGGASSTALLDLVVWRAGVQRTIRYVGLQSDGTTTTSTGSAGVPLQPFDILEWRCDAVSANNTAISAEFDILQAER